MDDSAAWEARYAAADRVWAPAPNLWVREAAENLPPGRALDLAAGEGRHAIWLAQCGWRVDAVDFSPTALRRAAQAAATLDVAESIRWIEADVVAEPPEPNGYDLVLVSYLQLPPTQLEQALAGAASAVGPGGCLVLVGHHVRNVTEGVGGPRDPRVLTDPAAVARFLSDANLQVERAQTLLRPVPGAARDAVDALVVARRA